MNALLTTPRLVLRQFIRSDLPAFTAYRSLADVAQYQSWEEYSAADADAFYAGQASLAFNIDESWFQIAVVDKQTNLLLGDVAVHFFDQGKQAELGMTFDPRYQRQGLASEALNGVISMLFNQYNKHRLVATVDARNHRAAHLLEKLGFRREAHFRQNIFFKGEWGDEYAYALLNSEWRAKTDSQSCTGGGTNDGSH